MCVKMGCGWILKRKSSTASASTKSKEYYTYLIRTKLQQYLSKKILIWSLRSLLMRTLISFIIIWVVIPVSFMLSVHFQTFMVFIPIDLPRNANFDKPEYHGIKGVHNFYITTRDINNFNTSTDIGVWLVLPESEMNKTRSTNVAEIIQNTDYDILIYLHGVCSNRAKAIEQYKVLRKQFLIIAVDHRGYGDSGLNVPMNEIGIAYDHVQIYDWIRSINSLNAVYYWGHSLGSGISTRTLKILKDQGHQMPNGIVLESPFTSFQDIVLNLVFGRIFGWLRYFDATVLKPLDQNGFHFRSGDNVLSIDCPIMILHAEDDLIVPYLLGEKLANIAKQNRRSDQGSVTFHRFPSAYGFGHNDIIHYPQIGFIIDDFKSVCRNFSTFVKPTNMYFSYFQKISVL